MIYPLNATSQSIDVQIVDDTGLPAAGLVAATFPTLTYSLAGANADVAFPALSDLASLTAAWVAGGVKERGNGVYRLDLPNGVFTTAGEVRIRGEAPGKHVLAPWIDVAVSVASVAGNVGGSVASVVAKVAATLNAADVTGNLPANLAAILATALTETVGGNLAAAFKHLLDVSVPALTAACVNQTGDSYPIVNSGTSGNAALLAAIQNVQNNTFVATSIPQALQTPAAGSATVNITIVFSDDTGQAKNLDSGNPAISLVNDAGTDLSARLGLWTNPATGKYVMPYTSSSSDATEGLHWDVSGTLNGKLRRMVAYTQIVDTLAVDFTSSDRTNLNNLVAAVGTAGAGLTNLGDARIPAIKAQTDKLTFVGSNLQAIVEAYAASQDAWSIIKAAVPSATPGAGTVELLLRLLDADTKIDTTTTPWDLVFYVKGGGAEILRKRLLDTGGANIGNTNTVLGQAIQ